jgi:hypothetical protein
MKNKLSGAACNVVQKHKSPKYLLAFCLSSLCTFFICGCASENQVTDSQLTGSQTDESQINMFDGKSLGKWQASDFFRPGKIYVKDGSIYIEKSTDVGFMQGIRWTGSLVKMNYEILLDAMRVEGSDFFCGLTFPVGEKPCTLILGGWGGTLCGLSSLDNMDASENGTTTFVEFENNRWYHVRLTVTPEKIQAWLDGDDEPLIDAEIKDRAIDIRYECEPSLPLGIATYQTTAAIRNIIIRKL